VRHNQWLNTPYGRRRDFFCNPRDTNKLFKESFAYIPQSTIAEKTKIGISETRIEARKKKMDFHLLSENHDSALAEVRIGQELDFLHLFKEKMEQPVDMRNFCLPRDIDMVIQFECTKGMNWKEMEDVEV